MRLALLRSRRARLAAVAAAAIAVAAVVAVLASGGGDAAANGRVSTASLATFHRAMVAKLTAQKAHFYWVACVHSGARFEGVPVVRCNVEFGDPHVQAYCAVFRGGRLVTSADDPAIPCRPDDVGFSAPIHKYS